MKRYISVLSSDQVNRYGDRFTVGALVSAVYDNCLLGIPNIMAHDQSRPLGWGYPFAVHMEPGLARLACVNLVPETEEDRTRLKAQFNRHYYETNIKANEEELAELRALLANDLSGDEKVIVCECVALCIPDLAVRAFPELFAKQDKDGLIPLEALSPIGPGVYAVGRLAVFAHHYLRRNLFRLNTLNYPVLRQLQTIGSPSNVVRIALDPDMIGLSSSYTGERMELQYWWGPKFNDDLTSIPSGVTHHKASEIEKAAFGILATQFRWGANSDERIFEAEELRDLPSATETPDRYGCRYVHSIVEKKSGSVVHLDGALRLYSEDKMIQRLELNLDKAPRNTEYTKLWRVDGSIGITVWKRLLSDYYRDNYLIGEYLGAEDEEILQGNVIDSTQERTLFERFVPYSMEKNQGVRITLSYADLSAFESMDETAVIPLDMVSDGVEENPYVESDALELRKALHRNGVELHIPDGTVFINFRDLYVNFPLVFLSGSSLRDSLRQIVITIKEIIDTWIDEGQDRVVCYRIGFPVDDDRAAIVSVLGHVDDLRRWLSSDLCYPPTNHTELRRWGEQVTDYLRGSFPIALNTPPLAETLMDTGVLLIDRKRIGYGNLKVEYSEEAQGIVLSSLIPEDEVEVAQSLQKAGVGPGVGMLIRSSVCTRCGESYRECACSKLMDDDVAEEFLEAEPFLFWTNRPVTLPATYLHSACL